jgi:large subunit ribosomal protein L30
MTPTSSGKLLRIRLVKSVITAKKAHKATVRALGLKRMNHEVVREDSAAVRGMIESVSFLVDVREVAE